MDLSSLTHFEVVSLGKCTPQHTQHFMLCRGYMMITKNMAEVCSMIRARSVFS